MDNPKRNMNTHKDKGEVSDQYEKNVWSDSNKANWPCGCTIAIPHSHLVAGYQCECEKGKPEIK